MDINPESPTVLQSINDVDPEFMLRSMPENEIISVRLTTSYPASDGNGRVSVSRDVHFSPAELLHVLEARKLRREAA
jgi:hypothetical protein